mgnify:FL=1|tara:strand:+ start:2047 stop:2649 length:603 start_codon:yes stop_codon:yes gene_type:complete
MEVLMMKKYQFCCDMDGVLCNFIDAATELVNKTVRERAKYKFADPEFHETILAAIEEVGSTTIDKNDLRIGTPHRNLREVMKRMCRHNEEFWANLEWNKGGRVIWNAIKDHNPYILSAPMGKSKESMAGKRKWIEKNLGVPSERIILDDDKYKYTTLDKRQGVLIDDMWFNIKPYRKHGGEAIYHCNMRTTMGLIKRYAE